MRIQELMKVQSNTLAFLQLSPAKRSKFGVRYYKLCDSASVCCMQFRIYTGNKVRDEVLPSNEAVVMEITGTYPTSGYTLCIDQFYSLPAVFHCPSEQCNWHCGTEQEKNAKRHKKTHTIKKMKLWTCHPQNGITKVAGPKTVLFHVHSSLQSLCDKQRQKEEEKNRGT